jgi:hypothetical protein
LASAISIDTAGESVANQLIVPVGEDGSVNFFSLSATDLVADVAGYVTGTGAPSSSSGLFVPLPPARVFDTRPGEPGNGPKGLLVPDSTIQPLVGGVGAIPATAAGVVLNLTLVGTTPGFATVWPTGSTRPPTSNVNVSVVGDVRPNSAIVGLGEEGRIDAYVLSGGHLIADTFGYLVA